MGDWARKEHFDQSVMLRGQCAVTDDGPSTILDSCVGKNPLSDPAEEVLAGSRVGAKCAR